MPRAGELAQRLVQPPWRDVLVATGLFAVGIVLYLAGLYDLSERTVGGVPPWRLAMLAAVCATLLLRRRHPAIALALGLPPVVADFSVGLSLAMVLASFDLLFCATAYGSARLSRAMVVAGVVTAVATLVVTLIAARDWRSAFLLSVQLASFLLIPIAWAREVRQHREIASAERTRAAQLERIAKLDRQAAITEERSRMARDLHDVIAGHLSAIAIQSEAVLSAERDRATVRTVLRSVRENSVAALTEMRAMIDLLRGDGRGADPPTAPARLADLDRLLDSARAGGLRVELTGPAPPSELPSVLELTAYRIVQEALTNAVKHAEGARAWVSLRQDHDQLIIDVTNELTHQDGPRIAGTGLASMRERAAAVGGSVQTGLVPRGWQVLAVLPVQLAAGSPEETVPT